MTAVTLTTLRARARARADQPVAGFVADSATELDSWINEGVQILHEKLVAAYGSDYVETSSAFTCSGSSDLTLPADFFKLLGVDINLQSGVVALQPYMRAERNAYRNSSNGFRRPRYKLSGATTLRLLPAPSSGTTGTIWYSPTAAILVAGSDAVNFPNGWERYVVAYAAQSMVMKEEGDTRPLDALIDGMNKEIQSIIDNRDAGAPLHAVDVDVSDIDPWVLR